MVRFTMLPGLSAYRFGMFLAALALLSSSLWQQVRAQGADTLLRQAAAEQQRFNYEKALSLLGRYHEQHPDDPLVIGPTAFCHFQLGRLREAKTWYHKAFLYDSTDVNALTQLSLISEREGNLAKAVEWFRRLPALDTANSYFNRQLGMLLLRSGDRNQSLTWLLRALRQNPADPSGILEVANLLLDRDSTDAAARWVETGLALDPDNNRLLYTKARIAYRQECYEDCGTILQQLFILGDSAIHVRRLAGYVAFQLTDWQGAIDFLTPLLKLDQERLENTCYYLAAAYRHKADFENAVAYYTRAIEAGISDDVPEYYSQVGELYYMTSRREASVQAFRMAYELSGDTKALFHLAQYADLYEKNKPKATALYREYLAAGRDSTYRRFVEERLQFLEK